MLAAESSTCGRRDGQSLVDDAGSFRAAGAQLFEVLAQHDDVDRSAGLEERADGLGILQRLNPAPEHVVPEAGAPAFRAGRSRPGRQ